MWSFELSVFALVVLPLLTVVAAADPCAFPDFDFERLVHDFLVLV